LILLCGLVSPVLADDEHGPMPELPGDLCEAYKPNQVCCPYVVIDNSGDLPPIPLPIIGKVAPIVKEAYRMHWAEIEKDSKRSCLGRA